MSYLHREGVDVSLQREMMWALERYPSSCLALACEELETGTPSSQSSKPEQTEIQQLLFGSSEK